MNDYLKTYLYRGIGMLLLGLVLYGIFSGTELVIVLMLFVFLRSEVLLLQYWRAWKRQQVGRVMLRESDRISEALSMEGDALERRANTGSGPRGRKEIVAEALGLYSYSLVIPLCLALWFRDLFSLRTPGGWAEAMIVITAVGLYGAPFLWARWIESTRLRIYWWVIPLVPSVVLAVIAVETRHPYLNPLNPDRVRLAAERVFQQESIVLAGRHADWVLRYARQSEAHGDAELAADLYREALRLEPDLMYARERLALLDPRSEPILASSGGIGKSGYPYYWTSGETIAKPGRITIGPALEEVTGCTVVLVAVGGVPERILEMAAHTIRSELSLPVLIADETYTLPRHTRRRGLVTGRQWEQAEVVKTFIESIEDFPTAPVKYVILTPADIYGQGTNFVFSVSYDWGGLVSFARFHESGESEEMLLHRTAKQTLSALLKSFPIPPSINRECVTSYSRSLPEFDSKGPRPAPDTLAAFRGHVDEINRDWRRYRRMGPR